ncbi:hypothetical protein GT043_12655, partial [Streptomyces sp. SID2131]|nr:hypothetical protein [Streptomyces sp. SID2131]
MSQHRSVRTTLLAAVLAAGLLVPLGQTVSQAAERTATAGSAPHAAEARPHPYDEADRLATAPPATAA